MEYVLIVNFKSYAQGVGENALKLSRIAEKLSMEHNIKIIIAAQPCDIRLLSENVKIPIFAQHVDPIGYGAHTGWILPESVKEAGAAGTLLNHSERRMDFEMLKKSVERCKQIGLVTCVCADTPENAKKIAYINPDYVAIEPPELIGGDISVSNAKPELIRESVEKVHEVADIPVLCGAGIKTADDVKKSLELGSCGVLVASGVVKSSNPENAIRNLINGFGRS
ncbi:MAG: triose-phosphate isomerase [Candidatus Aenigmarchaeota archaeon]|nr:triose-phosphate isomerase [Candidatus Aenigmarchaeota archaeon]